MRPFSKLVITLQVACITSTSVQFQSKERGNMHEGQIPRKNGSRSTFRAANHVPCRSSVFPCFETSRKLCYAGYCPSGYHIAQNEWTSLAIHDRRSGKFERTSAFNKL